MFKADDDDDDDDMGDVGRNAEAVEAKAKRETVENFIIGMDGWIYSICLFDWMSLTKIL